MNSTDIILLLLAAIAILFLLWRRAVNLLKQTRFAKTSLSTKYGKMAEQFMPFLTHYPHDPQRFRFLGTPIDGVQFEDDKIIFVEFKTNKSRLTDVQKRVIDAINKKRVYFEEFRIDVE